MKIEIQIAELQIVVDSLEVAINTLNFALKTKTVHRAPGLIALETLQMMRVSYMLFERNAAKEQREGRANDKTAHTFSNDCGHCEGYCMMKGS